MSRSIAIVRADQAAPQLAGEAERVRLSGALGRSGRLIRLFDFLVEEAIAGRIPKEAELAHHLFGDSSQFDRLIDASVRVYVHRLRAKLDIYYGDRVGVRLELPRGGYRLSLSRPQVAPPEDEADDVPTPQRPPVMTRPAPPGAHARSYRRLWLVLAAMLTMNLLAWIAFVGTGDGDPAAQAAASPFWRPLAEGDRMTFVVTGDYYIFGEGTGAAGVDRLVREFSINSREDLDQFRMSNPQLAGRYTDLNLYYLPTSTGPSLHHLLPIIDQVAPRPRSFVVPGSNLNADILKGANVVYVGFLSGLGLLRDPVFAASTLDVGSSYDELIDRRTGKRYASDWTEIADERTPRRDYGYLASLPGPSGNRILIVAGTRDAAVMQIAELAANGTQLDELAQRTGNADAMEALFEVRTLGNLNLGSTLIFARPMATGRLWQSMGRGQDFPDQRPAKALPAD